MRVDSKHVARPSLKLFAAVVVALVAAVWLIDSEESSETEPRRPAGAGSRAETDRVRVGSDQEAPHADSRVQDTHDRIASVSPPPPVAPRTASDGAQETGRALARALTASEIERRWQSGDPDDQAAAIDELNALVDRALAVDVMRQMIADERPRWKDPAWDALDALDPQLKIDAGAQMLFSSGQEQSAAVRLLAGDRWQPAQQVLGEILAITNANYESHGVLIALGLQSIGDGAGAAHVLRELKQNIKAGY